MAPLAAAKPSNQLSEPSFCHEYHCPVRAEFANEAATSEAAPTAQSQNAGGNEPAMTMAIANITASHACITRLRSVNAFDMRKVA